MLFAHKKRVPEGGLGTIALEDAEENVYAATVDAGHRMDPRARVVLILAVLLAAIYFFGLLVPKDLFNAAMHTGGYSAGYTFSWFVSDLAENAAGLLGVFAGEDGGPVPFSSTMIRYVVIALAGAGMALSGAVYQGTFRNALVSPSTLGVLSGATLGMMLWVVFCVADDGSGAEGISSTVGGSAAAAGAGAAATGASAGGLWEYLGSSYGLALMSFVGCLLVVAVVVGVGRLAGRGDASPVFLIITGQVIGSIMGAVSTSIRYYYLSENPFGAKAALLTDLQIASFYRTFSVADIVAIGIPLAAVFAVVMVLRRRMMVLSLDAGEVRAMGVETKSMQVAVVGLCTLLTALIVSFCGSVGFVGFLVPHLARRLVGPNFSYLLPAATVLGAVFVLGAYVLLTMTLGSSYETMVGMFISIGGAAVFLVTVLRGKGGSDGSFG